MGIKASKHKLRAINSYFYNNGINLKKIQEDDDMNVYASQLYHLIFKNDQEPGLGSLHNALFAHNYSNGDVKKYSIRFLHKCQLHYWCMGEYDKISKIHNMLTDFGSSGFSYRMMAMIKSNIEDDQEEAIAFLKFAALAYDDVIAIEYLIDYFKRVKNIDGIKECLDIIHKICNKDHNEDLVLKIADAYKEMGKMDKYVEILKTLKGNLAAIMKLHTHYKIMGDNENVNKYYQKMEKILCPVNHYDTPILEMPNIENYEN